MNDYTCLAINIFAHSDSKWYRPPPTPHRIASALCFVCARQIHIDISFTFRFRNSFLTMHCHLMINLVAIFLEFSINWHENKFVSPICKEQVIWVFLSPRNSHHNNNKNKSTTNERSDAKVIENTNLSLSHLKQPS